MQALFNQALLIIFLFFYLFSFSIIFKYVVLHLVVLLVFGSLEQNSLSFSLIPTFVLILLMFLDTATVNALLLVSTVLSLVLV